MTKTVKYVATFVTVMLLAGCGEKPGQDWQRAEGMIWNTEYHVTYKGRPELRDSIVQVLNRVGNSLDVFNTNSLVSRVNRQDSTPVNDDFIIVYTSSQKINRVSGGAFDPTLGPLIRAWGFGAGHKATADTARIDSLMRFVGIGRTRLRMDALVKDDPRVEFNFSAIAKGYGCDCVGEMLSRNGVNDWLVEIGGEVAARGKSPGGEKWRIAVDKPVFGMDTIVHDPECIVEITDVGMATSGNYRNFRSAGDGGTYGHTISAKTGRPVRTDVISATVMARTSMEADALATSFMAMGSSAVKSLNKSLRLPVMLVLQDSTVWTSEQFDRLIVTEKKTR